jgi:hypothetical protein
MSWGSGSQKFLPAVGDFWGHASRSAGQMGHVWKWANSLILTAEIVWLGCVNE